MSINIHTDYYEDDLENRKCFNCHKSFIVGKELAESVSEIYCPYCGHQDTIWTAITDAGELELGCTGIYFRKEDDRYYTRCIFCKEEITKDNKSSVLNACNKCTDK
ncbi:hypothetical protein [Paeniclostridium hominis]|uniref:hypothetical protein n=1 Tax=Paeniclostridium hominis TaxID=2764329 RepID=UPI0022E8E4D4|nr:hypothetical protein [Paeniclostridium hominis]